MTRPAPMTAEVAREIVATMHCDTRKPARIRLIRKTICDAIGAFCVFAIPYVFGLIIWAFN